MLGNTTICGSNLGCVASTITVLGEETSGMADVKLGSIGLGFSLVS